MKSDISYQDIGHVILRYLVRCYDSYELCGITTIIKNVIKQVPATYQKYHVTVCDIIICDDLKDLL